MTPDRRTHAPWAFLALLAASASQAAEPTLRREVYAMGTRLTLEVEGLPPEELTRATEAALHECERIEAACSTWRSESTWSQFNDAHGAEFALGAEWVQLLSTVLDWTQKTEGAFDPALGPLLRAWGTRTGGRTPTPTELKAARAASGARLLVLNPAKGTAHFTRADAGLEEGGFITGYALDRMAQLLRQAGVRAGLLDFGGQLLAFGPGRNTSIAAPDDRHRPTFELELHEASLSTSGTSERGRHLLDPRTGEPSAAWGSTSVVAPDALTADLLSTALYVLGPERGFTWAEAHQVAALFQRPHRPALATRAFRALFPRENHP